MSITTLSSEFIKILHIPGAKDSSCRQDAVSIVRVVNDGEDLIKIYPANQHNPSALREAFSIANRAIRITSFEPQYGNRQPLYGLTVEQSLQATYPLQSRATAERDWKENMVAYAEKLLDGKTRGGPHLDSAA